MRYNLLSDEEIRYLRDKKDFDDEDKHLVSRCTHIDENGDFDLVLNEKGTLYCNICRESFHNITKLYHYDYTRHGIIMRTETSMKADINKDFRSVIQFIKLLLSDNIEYLKKEDNVILFEALEKNQKIMSNSVLLNKYRSSIRNFIDKHVYDEYDTPRNKKRHHHTNRKVQEYKDVNSILGFKHKDNKPVE